MILLTSDSKFRGYIHFLLLLGILVIVYFFTLRFIFPGYFDPMIPSHSDAYKAPLLQGIGSIIKLFYEARFVGVLFQEIVAMSGLKGIMLFMIVLNLINIALTIVLFQTITKLKTFWPTVILYAIIILSHPGFYIKHTTDFFDPIAYFFTIATILIWEKRKDDIKFKDILLLAILIFLNLFTKETYFIALIIFWIFEYILNETRQKKNIFLLGIITIAAFSLVIIHSHLIEGIFINITRDASHPYFINWNPVAIMSTFLYYLREWWNPGIALMLFVLLIALFIQKNIKILIVFLLMALSAYMPYSLIPNHTFAYYFWLGVPLGYAPILFFHPEIMKKMMTNIMNKKTKFYSQICIIVFLAFSVSITVYSYAQSYKDNRITWMLQQEKINRNMLKNLPYLKEKIAPSDKVLVSGLTFPFHPFWSAYFINDYFGTNFNLGWTMINYNFPERIYDKPINLVNVNELDLTQYDKIFSFDGEGNLTGFFTTNSENFAELNRDRIIYPKENNKDWLPTY